MLVPARMTNSYVDAVVVVLVVVSKYGGGNTMLLVVDAKLLEVVVLWLSQRFAISEPGRPTLQWL